MLSLNFPPELILLVSSHLSPKSLNSLTLTCRGLHRIVQPELDALIIPKFGRKLLLKAADGNPLLVAKLLAPPFLIPPSEGYDDLTDKSPQRDRGEEAEESNDTPLHVAALVGNHETASLLLSAGADPTATCGQDAHQPLHFAAMKAQLPIIMLLLDYGAPIDAPSKCRGHNANGSPLGLAVAQRQVEVARLLLDKGANAAAVVPMFVSGCEHNINPNWTPLAALNALVALLGIPEDKYAKEREIAEMLRDALWSGLP
ncbi:ankyrin repeat-containing domain protein [Mycena polygramma]|nr:ankyrin repeat-containing domain protein [Mycena polygramma]